MAFTFEGLREARSRVAGRSAVDRSPAIIVIKYAHASVPGAIVLEIIRQFGRNLTSMTPRLVSEAEMLAVEDSVSFGMYCVGEPTSQRDQANVIEPHHLFVRCIHLRRSLFPGLPPMPKLLGLHALPPVQSLVSARHGAYISSFLRCSRATLAQEPRRITASVLLNVC
jgi:hypothetical protein